MTPSEVLQALEYRSMPRNGSPVATARGRFRGHHIRAESRWNSGRSGKGFTTMFYCDDRRIARAELLALLDSASA